MKTRLKESIMSHKKIIVDLYENALNLYNQGKLNEAEESFLEIIESDPKNVSALFTLGLIQFRNKNYNKAYHYLNKASTFSDDIKIKVHQGTALHKLGRYNEALDMYKKVLEVEPENIGILNNLSTIKLLFGNLFEAKVIAEKIISIKPQYIDPYINLGNILKDMGNIKGAIEYYEKALSLDKHNITAYSNMLLAMHYIPFSKNQIYHKHLEFSQYIKEILIEPIEHKLSLSRKINIGYLSGDFRKHSVSYFIEPILANHNLNKFNIFCYSDVVNPDPVTLRLKNYPITWRDIHRHNDSDVFKLIQSDKIDILIDLAGHAANKRIRVFHKGAAPIQVNYCGYPDTTGLAKVNYRITDNIADPHDADQYYTEKLVRMQNSFLCYRPSKKTPDISITPAIKNGFITFGSFNHLSKLSEETIELWSKLILEISNSHILLKAKQFSDKAVKDIIIQKFKNHGVERNRIRLIGHVSNHNEHLACYNEIDIALDPFPYNGTTTTCEALWMGVPVVTLYGSNHAGRVGGSFLTNIGLKSLVTKNSSTYIKTVKFLSEDFTRLNNLRSGLRQAMISSPICKAKEFTEELENHYKDFIKKEIAK